MDDNISLKEIIFKTEKFVSKNYKNPKITLQLLQDFMEDDLNNTVNIFSSSSSKSLIFLTKNNAYKLMDHIKIDSELKYSSDCNKLIEYNKEALPLKINCEEFFTICIKDILINPDINIIKYEKLKQAKPPKKLKKILILLFQMAIALKQIHKNGYKHSDVYLSNIGLRSKNEYVLYDFELAKKLDDKYFNEEMYKDVEMFLEDLIRIYTENNLEENKTLIENILEYLKNKYVHDSGKTKKIGRREVKIYEYT